MELSSEESIIKRNISDYKKKINDYEIEIKFKKSKICIKIERGNIIYENDFDQDFLQSKIKDLTFDYFSDSLLNLMDNNKFQIKENKNNLSFILLLKDNKYIEFILDISYKNILKELKEIKKPKIDKYFLIVLIISILNFIFLIGIIIYLYIIKKELKNKINETINEKINLIFNDKNNNNKINNFENNIQNIENNITEINRKIVLIYNEKNNDNKKIISLENNITIICEKIKEMGINCNNNLLSESEKKI